MLTEERMNTNPVQLIRDMYAKTQNNQLAITYYSPSEEPCTLTYEMDWSDDDAKMIVKRFDALILLLNRLAELHDELENPEQRRALLTTEELATWETYIRPFDPFEVDMSVVNEIYVRGRSGDLFEEEEEIWQRYCLWHEEQSCQRLPFNRRSSSDLIVRAKRYEKLKSSNAPQVVVDEEARCLAEAMVLYYGAKEKPLVWE